MNSGQPFVSVILPIRNEGKFIARTLAAVIGQTYPSDKMEIIVADGMSTDETRKIVKSFQEEHSHILLMDNPEKIVSTALNRAIQRAKGEVIIRVDGHTIIASDYVEQCIAALLRSEADNVGGRMTAVGAGVVGEAIALATSSRFGVGGGRFHYSNVEEWVDTVYMGAWRREVFEKFGLFDEEHMRNQDDEFNYRMREKGGRILLSPLIRSEYWSRSTLSLLAKQYFEYGFWKVRVLQKHPLQMRVRQFVPAVFVGVVIVGGIAGIFIPVAGTFTAVTLAVYCIANLGTSFLLAIRNGVKYFLFLPPAFAILHISYGAGFFAGLVQFVKKWGKAGSVPPMQAPAVVKDQA